MHACSLLDVAIGGAHDSARATHSPRTRTYALDAFLTISLTRASTWTRFFTPPLGSPLDSSSAGDGDGFWFNPTDAPQTFKNLTPLEAAHHFFVKGYQPEFHVANATLLGVEAALFNIAAHVEPVTSGACVAHPTALGCFFTSPTKAFPDEIGFAMFFAGLAYTGFIAALAVKNCKICKAFLLQNGFNEPELDGVTTYMVLRYAELLVRDGKLSKAKAYVKGVREECGYFITSYATGQKTYASPWESSTSTPVRSNIVAINKERDGTKKMKRTASSKRDKVGL